MIGLLSALDPGKQGLKRAAPWWASGVGSLSALDPGKQGLKLTSREKVGFNNIIFQRLIQENKD